jgi:hypothetical protein
MIHEPNFLLGNAFSLLTQTREYLIRKEDLDGVQLIEEQYQELKQAINNLYYKQNMEKKDVK